MIAYDPNIVIASGDWLDTAQPVNWDHPLNFMRMNWWKVVGNTGWRGSNLWHDIVRGGGHSPNDGAITSGTWQGRGPYVSGGSIKVANSTGLIQSQQTVTSTFPNGLSLACWWAPGYATGSTNQAGNIFGYSLGQFNPGFSLSVDNGGGTQTVIAGTPNNSATTGAMTFVVGRWMRLVGTYNGAAAGGDINLYVNGKAVTPYTGSGDSIAITAQNLAIGNVSGSSWNEVAYGWYDDCSTWGRVLTQADVIQDLVLSKQGYPGVLNYWQPKEYLFVASGGGTTWNITANNPGYEHVYLADAVARQVAYKRNRQDSVYLADTNTRHADAARQPADSVYLKDTNTRHANAARQQPDDVYLLDTPHTQAAVKRAQTDDVYLADVTKRLVTANRNPQDSLYLADVTKRLVAYGRNLINSLFLADANTRHANAARQLADDVYLLDAVSRKAASLRTLTDTIYLKDTFSIAVGQFIKVLDSIYCGDKTSRLASIFRNIQNSVFFADTNARHANASRLLIDDLFLQDIAKRLATSARKQIDDIYFADVTNRLATHFRKQTDTVYLKDTFTVSLVISQLVIKVMDSIYCADKTSTLAMIFRSIQNSIFFSDAVSRQCNSLRQVLSLLYVADLFRVPIPPPPVVATWIIYLGLNNIAIDLGLNPATVFLGLNTVTIDLGGVAAAPVVATDDYQDGNGNIYDNDAGNLYAWS